MALIPRIDELLAMDEPNIRIARELFAAFSQNLPAVIDEAAGIYATASRAFGQGLGDHFAPLLNVWSENGCSSWEDIEALAALDPAVHQLLAEFRSREVRGLLLARIGVLYVVAMTDFLRMRVTSPVGATRVQVESLALMRMMLADPSIACDWRNVLTEEDGKRFYRKYQEDVVRWLEEFNLKHTYDRASQVAMHSRFHGAALGLKVDTRIEGNTLIQDIMVKAQEFDPDRPHIFILEVLYMLRVQQWIFQRLPVCCPEITDPVFLENRVPQFSRNVDQLYREMLRQYPHLAQYQ